MALTPAWDDLLNRAAGTGDRIPPRTNFGAAPGQGATFESTFGAPSTAVPRAQSILTKPLSALDLLKSTGRGAATVGRGALRVLGRPAAMIPTAAGVLASEMAGGTVAAGADPSMFARALGEGYARYAPQFMGGLSPESIAAGDSQGASDIEGRFGAVTAPPAAPAPTSAPPAAPAPTSAPAGAPDMSLANELYAQDTQARPAPGFAPMSGADIISGSGIPAPGRGAAVNTRTGRIINLTSASTPDAADERANAMHAAGASVYGVGNQGFGAQSDLASVMSAAYGAKLRDRAATTRAAYQLAQAKTNMGIPAAAKAAAETNEMGIRRALAADYLRKNPDDVAGASVVLKGGALPGVHFVPDPNSLPDKTGAINLIQSSGPGAGTAKKVIPVPAVQPITMAEAIASAKANKTYKSDAQVRADMAKKPGFKLVD